MFPFRQALTPVTLLAGAGTRDGILEEHTGTIIETRRRYSRILMVRLPSDPAPQSEWR
jgi:hypothetical protein